MRKLLLILFFSVAAFRSMADEGMWLPLLLGEQVYNDMMKKGLKLTKDQLYNINKASMKDAIIIFGGFCTGEIVSNEGMIFTNHHCGYDAVASASSVEHNYLRDGFWAKTKQEEIPAPGIYAEFLLKIEDVTKEVEDSLKDLSGAARQSKLQSVVQSLNKRFSKPEANIYGRVSSLFKGNQFMGRLRKGEAINESMYWTRETSNSNYGHSKYLAELEVWRGIGEGLEAVIVNPSLILGVSDWDNSSSKLFKSAYDEFPWYTDGGGGFVDVRDVAKAMIAFMDSDISGERFIVSAENRTYRDVFSLMANEFGKRPPHKKVTPFLAGLVWRIEWLKSRITRKEPMS